MEHLKTINATDFVEDLKGGLEVLQEKPRTAFAKRIFQALEDSSIVDKPESARQLRADFYDFFGTKEFKEIYLKFFLRMKDFLELKSNPLIQKFPTPRVVLPKNLATSFHTDNWYGHGEASYTFWISLNGVVPGSGVQFVEDEAKNRCMLRHLKQNPKIVTDINALREVVSPIASEFLASPGQARLFHSSSLHGSPMNSADFTRISVDFRMCLNPDTLGSKNIYDYFTVEKGHFKTVQTFPTNLKYLKYINGETGFSTQSQHLLIDSFAMQNEIDVTSQEAEIENHNFPMLRHYLFEKKPSAAIEAIVLVSELLLPKEVIVLCGKGLNKIPLICALEKKVFL